MIVRVLVIQLFGVDRAPEAPAPRRVPAEIGDELFVAHGGSVRDALPRLNAMRLSQEDAAQVVARIFQRSGRQVGDTVRMPNGDLVLTPPEPGVQRPVNIISPGGQVRFALADVNTTNNPLIPFTGVTNVVSE
jgi:hypothetical protein